MVEDVELPVRRWGNSLGVRIPREIVLREGIKPNDTVLVQFRKLRLPTKGAFGMLSGWDVDPQELKERLREEHAW